MKTPASVLVLFCLAGVSVAQTAKQGDPNAPQADSTEFHSPMVIETMFAPADPALWKNNDWRPDNPNPWTSGQFTTAEYHGLGKYSCDGLSIMEGHRNGTWDSGLAMGVKEKGGKVHVTISARITNPGPIHDKFVSLLFDVLNGDEVVGKATITIKVKQDWRSKMVDNGDEAELVLSADSLKKNPLTKLRITMTTQDY